MDISSREPCRPREHTEAIVERRFFLKVTHIRQSCLKTCKCSRKRRWRPLHFKLRLLSLCHLSSTRSTQIRKSSSGN
ncbi:hypothetical protein J437_LFUL018960 [Ladona fulva]|uniref:Uncharacterized protein n=1 Tax=Ladona fulva TaxID=123851 RepID=A0A8K0KCR9_LADFU|nr:hypothetical protein J437_LFUL018960 [Ladona fulva]